MSSPRRDQPKVLSRVRWFTLGAVLLLGAAAVLVLLLRPTPAGTSTALKPPLGENVNRQGETVPLDRAGLSRFETRNTISGVASPQEVARNSPEAFAVQGGDQLYLAACASCHMQDGRGARGAGVYPALAGNPKMQTPEYVATLILRGAGGMPGFQEELTDQQVADIINYVRQGLNTYPNSVNATFVRPLRQPYSGPGLEGD